jgi:dipeptide/tripeptide permease
MMSTQTTAQADRAFFGHPRGLGFLVFAEAWERFSYYGMLALLALYVSKQLLLPGHVENVAGFEAFRGFLSSVYGANTNLAVASAIAGLYGAAVYVTPLAGGFIADRLIGRTMAITIGAVLMAVGHFLMAFEVSFLLALACLLAGVGLFKGNIATQVGELYAPGDLRRADAFQLYFIGISVAVIISRFVCGTLVGSVAFWRWYGKRWREPDEIVKLTIGAAIACTAPLMLALASLQEAATGRKVGLFWALGFHLLNDIGFANLFPVGLALFSRASPKAVAGLMIGIYYLNLFLAGLGVAKLGGLLDKLPPAEFWLLHAGLIALGAALLFAMWRLFGHVLAPTVDPEAA